MDKEERNKDRNSLNLERYIFFKFALNKNNIYNMLMRTLNF